MFYSCTDLSLPGSSSAFVGFASSSETSESSSDSESGDSSDFTGGSSGEQESRAKHAKKPAKVWRKGRRFEPKPIKAFDDSNVGFQAPFKLPVDAREVEYFKLYFDGELVGDIKTESNRYVDQLLASPTARTKTLRDWVRTTVDELYAFFAVVILMGVVVKKTMKDYWSTRSVT